MTKFPGNQVPQFPTFSSHGHSIFIFFFYSVTHHLFYLYIHQLFLFLLNLHHYQHILPPVILHPSSPPLLSPFTTLVGFSMRKLSSTLYLTLK